MYSLGNETSRCHFSRKLLSPFGPKLVGVKTLHIQASADVDIDRECFPYIPGSQIRT